MKHTKNRKKTIKPIEEQLDRRLKQLSQVAKKIVRLEAGKISRNIKQLSENPEGECKREELAELLAKVKEVNVALLSQHALQTSIDKNKELKDHEFVKKWLESKDNQQTQQTKIDPQSAQGKAFNRVLSANAFREVVSQKYDIRPTEVKKHDRSIIGKRKREKNNEDEEDGDQNASSSDEEEYSEQEEDASVFLPSLANNYLDGESDPEDVIDDIPQRKNRRGQRERRLIAEKKYGKAAKHLQNAQSLQSQKEDSRRSKKVKGDDRTDRSDAKLQNTDKADNQSRNFNDKRQSRDNHSKKESSTKESGRRWKDRDQVQVGKGAQKDTVLHPSWEARRNQMSLASLGVAGGYVSGKKTVFED